MTGSNHKFRKWNYCSITWIGCSGCNADHGNPKCNYGESAGIDYCRSKHYIHVSEQSGSTITAIDTMCSTDDTDIGHIINKQSSAVNYFGT